MYEDIVDTSWSAFCSSEVKFCNAMMGKPELDNAVFVGFRTCGDRQAFKRD